MNSFPVRLTTEQILELTKQFPKEIKILLMSEWLHDIKDKKEDFELFSNHLKNEIPLKNIYSELFHKLNEETNSPSIDLSIEGYDEPIDLDKAAFTEEMLQPLEELWKDEIPAEELVEMLTK